MAGNLNASRHPWRVFWRRRALKPESRWVLRLIQDYVPEIVNDKGGPENVSAGEMRIIETAAVARACWALAMADGDLRSVARFLAAERDALKAVGLERKPKPLPSLAEILSGPADAGTRPVTPDPK